jgi:hypothetical protein
LLIKHEDHKYAMNHGRLLSFNLNPLDLSPSF